MNDLMTKSFISYVDLKKEALKDLEAGPDPDLEMTGPAQTAQNLGPFLEDAEKVKNEMGSIRAVLGRIHESNEEGKSLHKPEALKALRHRINNDVVAVQRAARSIKAQLEEMDQANAVARQAPECGEGTPVDRARTAVTNGLRKKLRELMMEFQGLRQRMMAEYKETVGRRYFTVTGENPDEEEHGRGKVLETVVEIQDRHDAAKEVEKSLLELHQVFLDMAVMVEAQAEQLDDIHHHVINAAQYVNGGANNLKTAKRYQRSSRRWMCIGIVLLLILILAVIIPIATSFSKS
ncbi:syntaxin of plants 111 [Actinidia rufa]|uniref:Syntaxin of plants 111 n=1 Tax=Actinidia rufa TaxID=165716 RepID=A0A7J0GDD2_9ERIC|nr:syntaxin of plants 111 [Actinidia rufa]